MEAIKAKKKTSSGPIDAFLSIKCTTCGIVFIRRNRRGLSRLRTCRKCTERKRIDKNARYSLITAHIDERVLRCTY